MIIKSTDKTKKIEPIEGVAFHYVWQLVEFDIIKNGFARHTYKGDLHGGIERVRWCLSDVEKAFDVPRGTLPRKSWRCACDLGKWYWMPSNLFMLATLKIKSTRMTTDGSRLAERLSFTQSNQRPPSPDLPIATAQLIAHLGER